MRLERGGDAERDEPEPALRTDRRRARWGEFRRAYPGILLISAIAILVLVVADVLLVQRGRRYHGEIARLRSGMSDVERARADEILAQDENRLKVMVELIRRQARLDRGLHLTVSVDSQVMYLEQDGALLREIPIEVGAERTIGIPPDTVRMAAPRGTRTIERLIDGGGWEIPPWVWADRGLEQPQDRTVRGGLGPAAIVLSGGTLIYSMPSAGPLSDSTYVLPGSIRARAPDLKAILPNLKPGITVYLY
jgi:hypothetical protein